MSATITVRGLEDELHRRLKEQARRNHRSMEAEARAILAGTTTSPAVEIRWFGADEGPRAETGWIDRARAMLSDAWQEPDWDDDWLPERAGGPSRPAAELGG